MKRLLLMFMVLGVIGLAVVPSCSATLVNHTSVDCASTNPCSLTITSTTAGNALFVLGFVTSNSASSTSMAGCSGSWSTGFSFPNFDGHREGFLFYLPNVGSGCTSVQATFPANSGAALLELEESGVATSTPLDVAATAFTVGNGTCTSASLTPASAQNELFIGLYYEGTNGSQTWAGTSGWTMEQQQGNSSDGDTVAAADQIVASTTGTYTLSGTVTPGTNSRCAFATFKNSAAAPTVNAVIGGTAKIGGNAQAK